MSATTMPTVVVATPEATSMYRALVVPHLFAILIGTLLSGVVFLQLAIYYSRKTKSPRRLEHASVAVILVSSIVLLGCDWWSMYDLVVTHSAEPLYVMIFHPPDFLRVLLGAIGMGAAQVWFLDRAARILRMSKLFIAAGALLLLAEIGSALSLTTIGLATPGKPQYYTTMANLTIAWFWLGAAVDILATSVLCWKARQVFCQSNEDTTGPLKSLVRLTFATGLATSLVALAGGIVYLITRQTSNAFIPFIDALPRLSVFSMLITVNSRCGWSKSRLPNDMTTAEDRGPPPFILGFHKNDPSSAGGVYSPTLEEYKSDASAFDLSCSPPHVPRRTSAATVSASSNRYGWESASPRERKERPQVVGWAHVSEIGSVGDLERALKFYEREDEDGRGLSPNLAATSEKPPSTPQQRCSFSLPTVRRPLCRSRGCANGITVARVVTTEVDE